MEGARSYKRMELFAPPDIPLLHVGGQPPDTRSRLFQRGIKLTAEKRNKVSLPLVNREVVLNAIQLPRSASWLGEEV